VGFTLIETAAVLKQVFLVYVALVPLLVAPLIEGALLVRSTANISVEVAEPHSENYIKSYTTMRRMGVGAFLLAAGVILIVLVPQDATLVGSSWITSTAFVFTLMYVDALLLMVVPFLFWTPGAILLTRTYLALVIAGLANPRTNLKNAVLNFGKVLKRARGPSITREAITRLERLSTGEIHGFALRLQHSVLENDSSEFLNAVAAAANLSRDDVVRETSWQDYVDYLAKLAPLVAAGVTLLAVVLGLHYLPT
jgi:hypothetical protein